MKKYEIGTLGVQPVAPQSELGTNVQLPSVELQVSEPMPVIQKKPEQNNLIKEPEAESDKVLVTLETLCYIFVVTVLKTRERFIVSNSDISIIPFP